MIFHDSADLRNCVKRRKPVMVASIAESPMPREQPAETAPIRASDHAGTGRNRRDLAALNSTRWNRNQAAAVLNRLAPLYKMKARVEDSPCRAAEPWHHPKTMAAIESIYCQRRLASSPRDRCALPVACGRLLERRSGTRARLLTGKAILQSDCRGCVVRGPCVLRQTPARVGIGAGDRHEYGVPPSLREE